MVSEQLSSVPAKEMKDYDYLRTYTSPLPPEIDIAWSDAFPGAAAWLADRERRRRDTEKNSSDAGSPKSQSWQDGTALGGNFSRS